jgi:dTMP kinase
MFISFEGLDGSGKSTQAQLAAALLERQGREVVLTREPGGTPVGEAIREVVLHGHDMHPWTEATLYAASRAELAATVITPALERGAAVIADRYLDSSLAYQGIGRGLGVPEVLELNLRATRGLLPDKTFLLLVDPAASTRRIGQAPDRIERESLDFHTKVDAAYRELARTFPQRIVALDGSLPAGEIAEAIGEHLRSLARAA